MKLGIPDPHEIGDPGSPISSLFWRPLCEISPPPSLERARIFSAATQLPSNYSAAVKSSWGADPPILGEITGLQWAPSGLHPPQLDTKKQIAAILHPPEEEIKLEYANVQVNIYFN